MVKIFEIELASFAYGNGHDSKSIAIERSENCHFQK